MKTTHKESMKRLSKLLQQWEQEHAKQDRYTITCNGNHFGSYPTRELADSAWRSAVDVRPAQHYNFVMKDPSGQQVRSMASAVKRK